MIIDQSRDAASVNQVSIEVESGGTRFPIWKRSMDLIVSFFGLLIFAPLFVVIAAIIKLDSPGPVFFRQKRMGYGLQEFFIFKFRTMVMDAPELGKPLTASGDSRITRIGKILRKSKIDEIPQLLNVLQGDMTLVGPRPEVPRYVNLFRQDYKEILKMRPGITDLASLKYRNESDLLRLAADPEEEYIAHVLPDKIALAKEYVRRSSLLFDISLVLRTVAKTLVE
jgi:lipopolysaccharide/colanic/teichoic acid biosynthesis glycosyltransferase